MVTYLCRQELDLPFSGTKMIGYGRLPRTGDLQVTSGAKKSLKFEISTFWKTASSKTDKILPEVEVSVQSFIDKTT